MRRSQHLFQKAKLVPALRRGRRWAAGLLLIPALLPLGGCATLEFALGPATQARVPVVRYARPGGGPAGEWPPRARVAAGRTLLVFLPGRGTRARDFERLGFYEALPADGDADTVAVDLTLLYYLQRSMVDRLHDDVVRPARAAGYRRIVIVGVSMGSLGAMLYDDVHPGELDGVVMLGPFLGRREVVGEIERDGGLRDWRLGAPRTERDYQRQLWLHLQDLLASERPRRPALTIGYGTADRYGDGQRLLAANLPRDRVFTVAGGSHNWEVWRKLWGEIVRAGALGPGEERRD